MRKPLLRPLERFLQRHHIRLQHMQQPDRGQPQRGGIRVIGRLVQIDVVQRRYAPVLPMRQPQNLQRAIGQHLVDVHVGAGPCAALQRVHHNLARQLALAQLAAGLLDRLRLGLVSGPCAQRAIGQRTGQLHLAEGKRQRRMHHAPGQGKVLQRPCRVDAIPSFHRQRALAQVVFFDAFALAHSVFSAGCCTLHCAPTDRLPL